MLSQVRHMNSKVKAIVSLESKIQVTEAALDNLLIKLKRDAWKLSPESHYSRRTGVYL